MKTQEHEEGSAMNGADLEVKNAGLDFPDHIDLGHPVDNLIDLGFSCRWTLRNL